jgi:iron(III) transport system ATP-binding protein
MIAGFERLDSGHIEIAGQVVANDRLHVPPEKRRVGMVFQDYAIFPHLNVADNVAFGLGKGKKAEAQTRTMLDMVGLNGLDNQMPHELSGGQQQRVALARALALDPVILLLDEPFSNLDTSLRSQVRREVRELLKENGATAVFVTHDQEEALFLGDQVAVMNEGVLEQLGTPEELFHVPQTRFVAEFMGQTDFIPGRVTEAGVETVLGLLPQTLPLSSGVEVEIAVRSDDIKLEAVSDENRQTVGNGHIVSRQFIGIAHIYHVVLENGCHIHSWQPHTQNLAQGTAVHASFRFDHPLSCFYDDKAVF